LARSGRNAGFKSEARGTLESFATCCTFDQFYLLAEGFPIGLIRGLTPHAARRLSLPEFQIPCKLR
jgi:hypothetical protein